MTDNIITEEETNSSEPEPILTPDTLKDLLALRGITTSLSDAQLETLIDYKIKELEGLTGIEVYPTVHTDILRNFNDDKILLNYYPVQSVSSIIIDNQTHPTDSITLDIEDGIIYLNNNQYGNATVTYTACLSEEAIDTIFYPLLIDFIEYGLPESRIKQGATSVKEGDMQINYSTNSSETLSGKIQSRINALRNYNTRIRML